jgi:hypothetical protein
MPMRFQRISFRCALTLFALLMLTIGTSRLCHPQTVTQNAENLNIGFNGADFSGSDDQLPYIDQFFTDTKAFYATLGRQMPGNRHCHAYVSWDVGLEPQGSGDVNTPGSRAWLEAWLQAYEGHCDQALITFQWVNGVSCIYYACALGSAQEPPHPVEVGNSVNAVLTGSWPGWTGTFAFTPWNEPNNPGQSGNGFTNGIQVGARTDADYYLASRYYCTSAANCQIAAGDLASNGNTWQDSYQNCADDTTTLCANGTYLDTLKYYLNHDATAYGLPSGFRPEFYAYHGWSDANDFLNGNSNCSTVTTKTCITWLTYYAFSTAKHSGNGSWTGVDFWDTEVGVGQNHSVASPTNDQQAQAAAFLINLHATVSSRFFRIYYTRVWEPDGAYWSMFCSNGATRRQSEAVWADRQISYTNTGQSCP